MQRTFRSENLTIGDNLANIGTQRMIILRYIVNKWAVRLWAAFISVRMFTKTTARFSNRMLSVLK